MRTMSDYEDADFIKEPWTSPLKRKAKKESKNKKAVNQKKSRLTMTDDGVQKKKKSKFKEAMMERKEKKKEKRKEKDKKKKKGKNKNKNKLVLDVDEESPKDKLHSSSGKSAKGPKRKKMVVFGSLPSYIRIKRPIFNSSSPKNPEAAGEGGSCSQVMGKCQIQPHDHDPQYNSDEINSQDLFITQKTFRAAPSETSSSEASDRVISETPHVLTQRDKNQPNAAGERKGRNETSTKRQDRATHLCLREIKMEQEEPSSYLDDPIVINPTPDAVWIKHRSSYHSYIEEQPMCPGVANASTQTENFFTAELSTFLKFCWKNRPTLQTEDMKPLDLSLPQRAREELRLSGKMVEVNAEQNVETYQHKGETSIERSGSLSSSPQEKHPEVKREPSCQGEASPSPQAEAESKSANTTTSSEDDQHSRTGKRDGTQVGVVQLILNKPFFFKTKGEGQSPRPESPLMKLAQGRDVKTKKSRSGRT